MNFYKRVREMAIENSGSKKETVSDQEKPKLMEEVMGALHKLTERGVGIYNDTSGRDELSLIRLSEEILSAFLNLSTERIGFCLIAPQKFVVFLSEQPSDVLIYGKKKKSSEGTQNFFYRARQLIRITCIEDGNGYVYKDNTGAPLDPEEVIVQIIKWAVSD